MRCTSSASTSTIRKAAKRRSKSAPTCCGRTPRTPPGSAGRASASSRCPTSRCANCVNGSTVRAGSSNKGAAPAGHGVQNDGPSHPDEPPMPADLSQPDLSRPDVSRMYADHLATLEQRADEALSRGGFDALVVPSGRLHYQAFDDRDYPYA